MKTQKPLKHSLHSISYNFYRKGNEIWLTLGLGTRGLKLPAPYIPMTECGEVTKAHPFLGDVTLLWLQIWHGSPLQLSHSDLRMHHSLPLTELALPCGPMTVPSSTCFTPIFSYTGFLLNKIFAHLILSWDQLIRGFKLIGWPRGFWFQKSFS